MPQLGSFRARAWLAICDLRRCPCRCVFTPPRPARAAWPWSSDPATEAVGTAQWWKKHKKNAVFELGKGYKVEGVDGYFDGDGRPIASPVAVESVSSRRAKRRTKSGSFPASIRACSTTR